MTTATKTDLPAVEFASFHSTYARTVRRIASREHRGSSLYDVDDIEQAIWERVIVNWQYYYKSASKYVEIFMTRSARGFASAQRIDHMYATGAFIYTPKLVKSRLESCEWKKTTQALGVNVRADLVDAFERLQVSAPAQAAAVFKRYASSPDELSSNDRANCSRGVTQITDHLNSGLRLRAEPLEIAIVQEG